MAFARRKKSDDPDAGPPKRSVRDTAYGLLARRDHTVEELRRKLKLREFDDAEIEATLADFSAHGYLNDERYGRTWALARVNRSRVGPGRLRFDLLRKGFDTALVETLVAESYEENEERPAASEEEVALDAARRKARSLSPKLDREMVKRKLYDHLARRGFDAEVARRIVLDRFEEVFDS